MTDPSLQIKGAMKIDVGGGILRIVSSGASSGFAVKYKFGIIMEMN